MYWHYHGHKTQWGQHGYASTPHDRLAYMVRVEVIGGWVQALALRRQVKVANGERRVWDGLVRALQLARPLVQGNVVVPERLSVQTHVEVHAIGLLLKASPCGTDLHHDVLLVGTVVLARLQPWRCGSANTSA